MRIPIHIWLLALALLLSAGLVQAQPEQPTPAPPGPTLNAVLSRGEVYCGVSADQPGFSYLDPNTAEIRGFNADLCRALGAAIFGSPMAVQLRLVTADEGLQAVAAGELDIFLQLVTWNLTLDSTNSLEFGPVLFTQGQTFMVRADGPLADWPNLDGATICLVEGSPAAQYLPGEMARRGLIYQPVTLPTAEAALEAFAAGRCQALTAGLIELETLRRRLSAAADYRVWQGDQLPYTAEPLAPVYRAGDHQWADIVEWTYLGLVQAEQLGINSQTISDRARRPQETDAAYSARVGGDTARLLDAKLGLGWRLGLRGDFMAAVITQIGSYAEIYDRNLGAGGDLTLERGLNRLWRDGGLLYPPPWQ